MTTRWVGTSGALVRGNPAPTPGVYTCTRCGRLVSRHSNRPTPARCADCRSLGLDAWVPDRRATS